MNVTVKGRTRHYRTVAFDTRANAVLLTEQRLLPHQFKIVAMSDFRATARAIRDMAVRGQGPSARLPPTGWPKAHAPFAATIPINSPRISTSSNKPSKPPGPPRWTL